MDHVEALQQAFPTFLGATCGLNLEQQSTLKQVLQASAKGHTAVRSTAASSDFVRSMNGLCALTSLAMAEEFIAVHMQQRHEQSLRSSVQAKPFKELEGLSEEQGEAAWRALHARIFLLEGGPGTGKTFTAAWILRQLGETKWLALAPTGKAKAQLESSLARYGMRSDWTMTVQAALSRQTRDEGLLDAEVILVDESSMLDSLLFYRLIKALKPSSRLLLLGDRHQLPPVGPGQPFADLCCAWQGGPCHCRLGQSKRVEISDLLQIAQAVQQRRLADLPLRSLSHIQRAVGGLAGSVLAFHQRELPQDLEQLAKALQQRMVLGALQEGNWGVERLQQDLADMSVDPTHPLRPAPLMVTSNVERADLWNGDLGWLCRPLGEAPFVLMAQRSGLQCHSDHSGAVRRIPLAGIPSWDYAWMLTVHKSQGSEFQRVAVVLPPGAERFGPELLYTAVTRARRELEIWSWPWVVEQMLSQETSRLTWLQQLLPPHSEVLLTPSSQQQTPT